MVSGELSLRERSDVVSHLLPGGNGQLHQPLDHWVDVDEVQTLDLVGLQSVGTLHLWQHCNYLLCQCSECSRERVRGGGGWGEKFSSRHT